MHSSLNYLIFSTLLYFTNNFDYLSSLNKWMIAQSYLLITLDTFNNDLINSIVGIEVDITN